MAGSGPGECPDRAKPGMGQALGWARPWDGPGHAMHTDVINRLNTPYEKQPFFSFFE